MRYLVTGAAGFIGSKIARELTLSGNEVLGVDSYNNYYDTTLKQLRVSTLLAPLSVQVKQLDICDTSALEEIVRYFKPNGIFHLAAQAGVRIPLEEIDKYAHSNLVGFTNILKTAIVNKVPNFIYASSSSVYGDSENYPYRETDLNIYPKSYYGVTKRTNEMIARALIPNSGIKARGLRFFTVYGPWGRPDMAYLRLINSAIHGNDFNLFGDGTVERDFTYIDDVCNSSIELMTELNKCTDGHNDLVNIGGGTPVSMSNLIQEIESQTGAQIHLNKYSKHDGDVSKTIASEEYLSQLIGKKSFTDLRQGIQQTLNWAINPDIKNLLPSWVTSTK